MYTWLILQFCGLSGPTGTHGSAVLDDHTASRPGSSHGEFTNQGAAAASRGHLGSPSLGPSSVLSNHNCGRVIAWLESGPARGSCSDSPESARSADREPAWPSGRPVRHIPSLSRHCAPHVLVPIVAITAISITHTARNRLARTRTLKDYRYCACYAAFD